MNRIGYLTNIKRDKQIKQDKYGEIRFRIVQMKIVRRGVLRIGAVFGIIYFYEN